MMIRIIRPLLYRAAMVAAAVLVLAALPANPAKASSVESSSSNAVLEPRGADSTESRIQKLHDKLKVTPEQEPLWRGVAQVMRDNASKMACLVIRIKSAPAESRNVVDDIKAYGEIAAAHADGIQSFIPVFEAFYASLSDEQKKIVEREDMKF
jgi:hypothetical protein